MIDRRRSCFASISCKCTFIIKRASNVELIFPLTSTAVLLDEV